MEDFFKQFRENLESRPEPAFEERDWKDMQARLERDGGKRPAAFAWGWLALPFVLLLTGSNAFFFWQWKKAEQRVSTLEIRRDTVFHTRVVHTADTIYRTRVLRERVVEYQTSYVQSGPGLLGKGRGLGESGKGGILVENRQGQAGDKNVDAGKDSSEGQNLEAEKAFSGIQNGESGNDDLKNIPPKGEKTMEGERLALNTSPLPLGEIQPVQYRRPRLQLTDCEVLIPAKKHQRSFSEHLYAARPKDFQVGVSGGLAYPFGNGVDFKSGYSVGLRTAVEFSPRLRLWADAAYFKTLFLTDRMGDDIGVPIVGPPSAEYLFLQAEVPQPFFQYSVGMQYLFRSKHRLKPFVGLGLGAISLLPYDVIYEFENTTLGVEWDLDQTIHRQGLITNFLVLPLGLEYGFSKHWNAQVQATYRYNWKGTGAQSPNMLGIQGGLNYRF
ncbi:MAG: outer membrane beta-barrel protein [Saprospiraceae bacterium]